ncbi:MmgE/PrpD family protein [Paraburkholderia sp.]|jgi:aconitate decarboxylase|uniref:MmgE/PrpD family protein n=1 Tax=Paraburkholderia sp. TaxID=1926495 RepID=UPI002F40669F
MSLAAQFTDLILGWPADDPALLERVRQIALDGLAVAAAGSSEPGPTHVSELSKALHIAEGPSSVIGHGYAAPSIVAARINGMSMHVLDFEPMWNPPNHAVSSILPALLALAEAREQETGDAQGEALLRAFAKGIEAQGRLRLSSQQIEPAQLSLHPPGIVGPLAAALACANLLGLDRQCATAALGIAASRSGGVLANIGSQTKALHCGDSAAHGLEAALLAARGFTAGPDALGGPRGWGHGYFGDRFDADALLAPIGAGRALEPGLAWKLFPSQFATHYAITAALDARAQVEGFDAAQIERIELRVPVMPYIDRPKPETGLDGKFSWQYTVAIALIDGQVVPASFADTRRFAPDVDSLLERIVLNADASIAGALDKMNVEIALHLRGGRIVKASCMAPLGSWHRPVGADAVRNKAAALFTGALGEARAQQVLALADSMSGPFEVRRLMSALR